MSRGWTSSAQPVARTCARRPAPGRWDFKPDPRPCHAGGIDIIVSSSGRMVDVLGDTASTESQIRSAAHACTTATGIMKGSPAIWAAPYLLRNAPLRIDAGEAIAYYLKMNTKALVRVLYANVPGLAAARYALGDFLAPYASKPEYVGARLIRSGLIVDIGANRGQSIAAFKRLSPGSTIVAFEPAAEGRGKASYQIQEQSGNHRTRLRAG